MIGPTFRIRDLGYIYIYTYKFIYLNVYIFKISPHRWSSMVVGSKGWAERRYIREVMDVQGSSDTSRILKDIQEAFSRSNTEGRTKRLQSQCRRFYASSACRGAITVPTVATSEVLRFECLSRCYSSGIQSQCRRFYAPSACP